MKQQAITRKQLLRYLKGKRLLSIDMEADIIETTRGGLGSQTLDQWRTFAATGLQTWKLTVTQR